MAITKMAMLVVVVVGLLAMVQQSVQMSDDTSLLRETGNDLDSWAIVVSRKTSERAILDSGDFVPGVKFVGAGRVFQTGTLIGRRVVLVNTGKYSANVASALQSLLSFQIRGVLYLGLAADLRDRRPGQPTTIGSVVVPESVAFTAIWDWLKESNAVVKEDLVFGDFNKGQNQQNALGSVKFNNAILYTGASNASSQFYFETDEAWLNLANLTKPSLPGFSVTVGLKVSSSDMTVKNAAYASFLRDRFGFSTVDQESATVALVSKSNNLPYIVFHGISNRAAGLPATELGKRRAARNAYLTLITFLGSLPEPRAHLTTDV